MTVLQIADDYPITWEADGLRLAGRCAVVPAGEGAAPLPVNFRPTTHKESMLFEEQGTVQQSRADVCGLKVELEWFCPANDAFKAVRIILKNESRASFALDRIRLLDITSRDELSLHDSPVSNWRVTRMSRHKNDVPGTLNLAVHDDDLQDALFESSDVAAGHGVTFDHLTKDATEGEHVPKTRTAAEPCLLLRGAPDKAGLFLGMMGQADHLSTLSLTLSEAVGQKELAGLAVDCAFDGVTLAPGERRQTEWLLLFAFDDEFAALNHYADLFARHNQITMPPRHRPSLYCSWYYYGLKFGQAELHENLAELKRRPIPFDLFMIDGSWMDDFGSWQPNDMWPDGMAAAAEAIRNSAMTPGIWTAPFVVMADSPILEKYPDLVARNSDGSPCLFNYNGPTCYVVDVTAPSAKPYLDELYGRLRGWGYRHHKLDFLRAVISPENIRFRDPGMTRAQAYRHGLQLVRDAAGPDAYIIACGGLFEGSAGLMDAMRTGSDTVGDWSRAGYAAHRPVCEVAAKQSLFRSYTARFWHTDPDALMLRLRSEPVDPEWPHLSLGTLTDEEAFTLLAVQYVCGGIACVGERFKELGDDRHALLRHLLPQVASPARPLDWHHALCPTLFQTDITAPQSGLRAWQTLTVVNWQNHPVERSITLSTLPSAWRTAAVFEFRTQTCLGVFRCGDTLELSLPARGTRVLRLAEWDGVNPVILGTDCHITGGACELHNVRQSKSGISGSVRSLWPQYPVRITVAFPVSGQPSVRQTHIQSPGEFALNPAFASEFYQRTIKE